MIKVALIAAVAENGVIGRNGDLPWRIKSEMKYFKATTISCPVIHGRKSFESLGKPLPDRANIVITRDKNYAADGVIVVYSLDEALARAKTIAKETGVSIVFVCGGENVYRESLPLADRLYLTEVHLKPEGDTRFPGFDRNEWIETKREFHKALPGEDADYTITVLERKRA